MEGDPQPPPSGPPPSAAEAGNPWERRSQLGFGVGLIENIKLFVMSPTAAFDQTVRRGDFASPLLFAVIVGTFCGILGQLWSFLLQGSLMSLFPQSQGQFGFFMTGGIASLMITIVLLPVFLIVGLFIGSVIYHLFLMLVGGLAESRAGFEGSFRAVSYAGVAQLANLVPIIGWLIGLVWGLVLVVIGLSKLHDTSQGKATAAVLIPIALCCVCLGVAIVLLGGAIVAWMSQQAAG